MVPRGALAGFVEGEVREGVVRDGARVSGWDGMARWRRGLTARARVLLSVGLRRLRLSDEGGQGVVCRYVGA
jgi:hypothetical protein